jgi:hypothetical protein
VNNVEGALVPLARDNHANASSVLAAVDHGKVASLELDELNHLV